MKVGLTRGSFGSIGLLVGFAFLSRAWGGAPLATSERFGNGRPGVSAPTSEPWSKPVLKAECGKSDRVESALQGEASLAERMSGASSKAFNCNLELVGQLRGEGASYQMAAFDQCAYYATANREGQQHKGVVVVDVSDPRKPMVSAYLEARTMWDPWESLKVNVPRKLLAAVQSDGGSGKQPGFAVYDISDCRRPVLKSSVDLGAPVKGHAGHFAPDGRTYYGTYIGNSTYPIDIENPSQPKLLGVWPGQNGVGVPHDISLNAAGNRLYTAQPGGQNRAATGNGLVITDVSDFQARRANPEPKVIASLFWKDGSIAQMTERVQIGGRPYLIFTDEGGSSGLGKDAKAACAQNLPPFGFARIIDIADEKNPRVVSKLMLEVHDPANCAAVEQDTGFSDFFGYSSHYCTADNPENARYLACSYFEAGLRVFDIRDPYHPKEIAYYKPPAVASVLGTSVRASLREKRSTDWTSSNVGWHRHGDELQLWFTSQDNGFQIVKFTNRLASLGKTFEMPNRQLQGR
jgi:hypothetical protein